MSIWNNWIGKTLKATVKDSDEQIESKILSVKKAGPAATDPYVLFLEDGMMIHTDRLGLYSIPDMDTLPEQNLTIPPANDFSARQYCRRRRVVNGKEITGMPELGFMCPSIMWGNPICVGRECPRLPQKPARVPKVEEFIEWADAVYFSGKPTLQAYGEVDLYPGSMPTNPPGTRQVKPSKVAKAAKAAKAAKKAAKQTKAAKGSK